MTKIFRLSIATLLCFFSLPGNANAQEKIVSFPTRDVMVHTKSFGPAGPGASTRSMFLSAERKERLDGGSYFMLTDHKAGTLTTVVLAAQPPYYAVLTGTMQFDYSAYTPTGKREVIAGHECREWQHSQTLTVPNMGTFTQVTLVCFTADGVKLRTISETVQGSTRSRFGSEAISVIYGPQDVNLFRIPANAVRR